MHVPVKKDTNDDEREKGASHMRPGNEGTNMGKFTGDIIGASSNLS
jgi:hypothetical protein